MAEDLDTTCPWCNYHHNAVSEVQSDDAFPSDGDVTLCFNCGNWCIFDHRLHGGLRRPTQAEHNTFTRDEDLQKLVNAWKTIKRG